MKSNLLIFVSFSLGAACGAYAGYKVATDKYNSIMQEEVESIKASFSKANEAKEKPSLSEMVEELTEKETQQIVKAATENLGYSAAEESKPEKKVSIEIIHPEEFAMEDDYDTTTLTYFEDEVLVDELNEKIEDVEELIGPDALNHFGEYEEDSVYVRNHNRMTDYEILKDARTYKEVLKNMPHSTEE